MTLKRNNVTITKLLLLTGLMANSIFLYPQIGAWSLSAKHSYAESYCDAFVRSQDQADQFTIRFHKEGLIEYFFITNREILARANVYLVYDSKPSTDFTSMSYTCVLIPVEGNVYRLSRPGWQEEYTFSRMFDLDSSRSTPMSEPEMISLFKNKTSFRLVISTSNDYTTSWYDIYYSLNGSTRIINVAQNYPYIY